MQNNSSCDVVGWAFWLPLVISTPGIHHSSLQLDSLSLTFFLLPSLASKPHYIFLPSLLSPFFFNHHLFRQKRIRSTFIFLSKTGSGLPLFFHFFFSEFQVNLESFIFLCIWVIFYFLFFGFCCRFCFVLLNSIREMDIWGVFRLFKLKESLMNGFDFYTMCWLYWKTWSDLLGLKFYWS